MEPFVSETVGKELLPVGSFQRTTGNPTEAGWAAASGGGGFGRPPAPSIEGKSVDGWAA